MRFLGWGGSCARRTLRWLPVALLGAVAWLQFSIVQAAEFVVVCEDQWRRPIPPFHLECERRLGPDAPERCRQEKALIELFRQNVETVQDVRQLMCQRPLNPKFKEFSEPAWKPLDVWENRALFKETVYYQHIGVYTLSTPIETLARERGVNVAQLEQRVDRAVEMAYAEWKKNGLGTEFALAEIDVDGDGSLDSVFRLSDLYCDQLYVTNPRAPFTGSGGRYQYYVLTPDKTRVDAEKTFDFKGGQSADLFLYHGKPYTTQWLGGGRSAGIYIYGLSATPSSCRLRYVPPPTTPEAVTPKSPPAPH